MTAHISRRHPWFSWSGPLLALVLVGAAGCGEDEPPNDSAAGTDTTDAASGDGAGSGGGCVDGAECVCPDGSPSLQFCAPDAMCFCPEGEGASGGQELECGISVRLMGAFDGTYETGFCGLINDFGMVVSYSFGGIFESQGFELTVAGPIDGEFPLETTGRASYRDDLLADGWWSTPDDSCMVTITAIETVDGRRRVTGYATCPQPATLEEQPALSIGDFDFSAQYFE